MFSQKVLMKKKKKQIWNFKKEEKRNRRRIPRRREEGFWRKGFGGNKREKPLKLQENGLFATLPKIETKMTKTQTPKKLKKGQKHLLASWTTTRYFWQFSVPVQLTIDCFAENSVFCKAQLLCITGSDTPFRHPFQQPPFWKGGCNFWKLPKFTVLHILAVFWVFWTPPIQKMAKTVMCTENPFFQSSKTVSVSCFSKNLFLAKSTLLPTTPKIVFLSIFSDILFFLISPFSVWLFNV